MISVLIEGRWMMGQLVVRNIENAVKTRLQRRAKRHGRSMEEEVRDILRSAVSDEEIPSGGLGTDISRLFMKIGLDSDVAELRGHAIKPATFEQ
jgi:plasmid stability protein